MSDTPPLKMRSWLFAPGDSDKKMAKATDGSADIVLLDLEDAVMDAPMSNGSTIIYRRSRRRMSFARGDIE